MNDEQWQRKRSQFLKDLGSATEPGTEPGAGVAVLPDPVTSNAPTVSGVDYFSQAVNDGQLNLDFDWLAGGRKKA
jgi:hypothetical protein